MAVTDSSRMKELPGTGNKGIGQSLEALEKRAREQRILLDNIPLQVWYLSDIDTYGRVNLAHARFLGFHPREIAYKKLDEFLPSQVAEVCRQSNRQVFGGKETVCTEEWVFDARSEKRLLEIIKTPQINARGDVEYVVCTASDITRRRHAEQALKESEKKYRKLIDSMVDVVYLFSDRRGGLFFSPSVEKVFGYSMDHMYANPFLWNDSIHPLDKEAVSRAISRAGEGKPFTVDYRIRDARGNWIWLSDRSITEYKSSGEIIITGVARDITEQKQLESQVRHLQKTESLGRMAGAVAHHYNNMMAIVMGHLEMALYDMDQESSSCRHITDAIKGTMRAVSMSQTMLSYLGKSGMPLYPLDLATVSARVIHELKKEIDVEIVFSNHLHGVLVQVMANRDQIKEILKNLIVNAWESMADIDRMDPVHIELTAAESHKIPRGHRYPVDFIPRAPSYACMEVADKGAGIPEEDMEKIFDPFYSSKFLGRGLGLALTLSMVKAHDGCISVEGGQEKGTVFRLFLPVLPIP
ncbi:MAG: PAS domain S-box protein [Desulfamplus sp.]|nr:PAS domain S-box protein [Desulfamplus sp.]